MGESLYIIATSIVKVVKFAYILDHQTTFFAYNRDHQIKHSISIFYFSNSD
jgi:hypothetical protein